MVESGEDAQVTSRMPDSRAARSSNAAWSAVTWRSGAPCRINAGCLTRRMTASGSKVRNSLNHGRYARACGGSCEVSPPSMTVCKIRVPFVWPKPVSAKLMRQQLDSSVLTPLPLVTVRGYRLSTAHRTNSGTPVSSNARDRTPLCAMLSV